MKGLALETWLVIGPDEKPAIGRSFVHPGICRYSVVQFDRPDQCCTGSEELKLTSMINFNEILLGYSNVA